MNPAEPCGPGCGAVRRSRGGEAGTAEAARRSRRAWLAHVEERAAEVRRAGRDPERLAGMKGKKLWRSLEELAGNPGLRGDAAPGVPAPGLRVGRGAGDPASPGAASSSSPAPRWRSPASPPAPASRTEKIVPYVEQPEEMVPGKPLYFATAFTMGGYAQGVLVESHTGRPTKVEGNPDHPANPGGGTDLFAQASILQLYDPDRSGRPHLPRRDPDLEGLPARLRDAARSPRGSGARAADPDRRRHLADPGRPDPRSAPAGRCRGPLATSRSRPAGTTPAHAATGAAFGRPVETRYDLARGRRHRLPRRRLPDPGPGMVRYARAWAERRAPRPEPGRRDVDTEAMNRLYAARVHAVEHRLDGRSPHGRDAVGDRPASPCALAAGQARSRRCAAAPVGPADRGPALGRGGGRRTCAPTAAAPWSWPATACRRRSTPWPTPSTPRWGAMGTTVRYTEPVGRTRRRSTRSAATCATWCASSRPATVDTLVRPRHQPGVRRPGRPRFDRGADARPAAPDPRRALPGRDRRALPVARARGPLPRELERRPLDRRHGDDPPAADRAALRRADGPRVAGASAGRAGAERPRLVREQWRSARERLALERCRVRPRLAAAPARRLRGGAGHGAAPGAASGGGGRPATADVAPGGVGARLARRGRSDRPTSWRSPSAPTRRSGTAATPTTLAPGAARSRSPS